MRKVLLGICSVLLIVSCTTTKSVETESFDKQNQENYKYAFNEALRFKLQGNTRGAAKMFTQSIAYNPEADAAYYELAKIYLGIKDIKTAYNFAQKAYNLSKGNEWYCLLYGQTAKALNKVDTAIIAYKQLNKIKPGNINYSYGLGVLLLQNNQPKESLEVFKTIAAKHPDNEQINQIVLDLVLESKDTEEYAKLIDAYIKRDPSNPKYLILKGEFLMRNNKLKEADVVYNKVISENPDYVPAKLSYLDLLLKTDEVNKVYNIANYIVVNKSVGIDSKSRLMYGIVFKDSVFTDSVKITKMIGSLKEQYPDDSRVYDISSIFYIKKDAYDIALKDLDMILKLEPNNVQVLARIIKIYEFNSNWAMIKKYGDIALGRKIINPEILFSLAIAESFMGNDKKAVEHLEKFLTYDDLPRGTVITANMFLGDIYHKLGNRESSYLHYEVVLKYDPTNIYVLNNYSYYISVKGGDLNKAERMSRITIEAEPQNPTYLDTYAWILYKKEDFKGALKYMKQAIDFSEEPSKELFFHYGVILGANKQYIEALKYLNKAKELGKKDVEEYLLKFTK
jgi:tetratricopeptide (TPR) repeat protein